MKGLACLALILSKELHVPLKQTWIFRLVSFGISLSFFYFFLQLTFSIYVLLIYLISRYLLWILLGKLEPYLDTNRVFVSRNCNNQISRTYYISAAIYLMIDVPRTNKASGANTIIKELQEHKEHQISKWATIKPIAQKYKHLIISLLFMNYSSACQFENQNLNFRCKMWQKTDKNPSSADQSNCTEKFSWMSIICLVIFLRRALWTDSVSALCDQVKPIRIEENLELNYNKLYNRHSNVLS